jgi:hypothetical protein
MKTQVPKVLLVILTAVLLNLPVHAQQAVSEEQRLRVNIQRLIENGPPPSVPDEDHRKALLTLRGQLLRVLLKRSGSLETRIANLEAAGAAPEVTSYAGKLRDELKTVNDEITGLDQTMAGVLPPVPSATPAPVKPGLNVKTNADRANFERDVASFSPSDLKAAAVPAEVVKAPAPTCDDRGLPVGVTVSMYDSAVCTLAKAVAIDKGDIDLENQQKAIFTILTAKLLKGRNAEAESYAAFVTEAQERRIDQQVGAAPTSNSATSIVSKGGIPYLFGFAVENGAATQSEKDTSITFRVNPGGLINLFANRGFITGYRESEHDPVLKLLRKTSIGLTFDTTRGDTPGVFTGRGQQLSEISARLEFFNDRDPRNQKYAAAWANLVATEGLRLAEQTRDTTAVIMNWGGINDDITFKEPSLQAWLKNLDQAAKGVNPGLSGAALINATAKVIDEQADNVPVTEVSEKTIESLTNFAGHVKTYSEKKNELFDRIAKGRILTFEYTNKREVNAPNISNFNFIGATGMGSRVDLTANGSLTFFHSRPPLASLTAKHPGRIRDFQFAGQIDVPFGEGFDLWFSGRYERLMEDASLATGVVLPGTKGDIAIGQVGLNVPLKGLGVKFPISVTFANRTELIKERVVRGNFGFTFNWDTLLSKLKPF